MSLTNAWKQASLAIKVNTLKFDKQDVAFVFEISAS